MLLHGLNLVSQFSLVKIKLYSGIRVDDVAGVVSHTIVPDLITYTLAVTRPKVGVLDLFCGRRRGGLGVGVRSRGTGSTRGCGLVSGAGRAVSSSAAGAEESALGLGDGRCGGRERPGRSTGAEVGGQIHGQTTSRSLMIAPQCVYQAKQVGRVGLEPTT